MTIFVSVASYCDDLLLQTLADCHDKAAAPEAVFFGVVNQDEIDIRQQLNALPYRKQIRYLHINPLDSRGVSWARYIAYSLYGGEDYFLQIDAHMQFDVGWDEILIRQLQELAKVSAKPILTAYPHPFEMKDGRPELQPVGKGKVMYLRPKADQELTPESPAVRFHTLLHPAGEPVCGGHIAGGFLFTLGAFIEEVPYDPYLYFTGEEHSLAARAYTHGWDIFHPVEIPLYHLYRKADEKHRGQHWDERFESERQVKWQELRQRGMDRLRQLLLDGKISGTYGLGKARGVEGLQPLSGVDYPKRQFNPEQKPVTVGELNRMQAGGGGTGEKLDGASAGDNGPIQSGSRCPDGKPGLE